MDFNCRFLICKIYKEIWVIFILDHPTLSRVELLIHLRQVELSRVLNVWGGAWSGPWMDLLHRLLQLLHPALSLLYSLTFTCRVSGIWPYTDSISGVIKLLIIQLLFKLPLLVHRGFGFLEIGYCSPPFFKFKVIVLDSFNPLTQFVFLCRVSLIWRPFFRLEMCSLSIDPIIEILFW